MIQLSKKSNSLFVGLSLLATIAFSSCSSPAQKVNDAKDNVTEAKENLQQAQEDYQTEVDNFKKESNDKISENEKIIADLKSKMNTEKKESREAYRKQITELEQKNEEIKIRLDEYKYDTKDNWEIFKSKFNHDMDEIGNSLKEIGNKND